MTRKLRTRVALSLRAGDKLDAQVFLALAWEREHARRKRVHLNALKLHAKRYRRARIGKTP